MSCRHASTHCLGRCLGILALALQLSGCGGDGGSTPATADLATTPSVCQNETRADSYVPGMEKLGQQGLLSVQLVSSQPGPPALGTNSWDLKVHDTSGTFRSDLTISALPWMPDHNHGTSVKAAVTPTGTTGEYTVAPLYLFMAGLWQVTLKLQLPNLSTDQVVFSFCIDGN